MAVAQRGVSQYLTFQVAGTSPSFPAGKANGDLLLGAVASANAITLATGWNSLLLAQDSGSAWYYHLCYRVADGSANDQLLPGNAGQMQLALSAFSGVDTVTPIGGFTNNPMTNTASFVTTASTPDINDAMALAIFMDSQSLTMTTPPAGFTEYLNQVGANGERFGYLKSLTGQNGVSQGPFTATLSGPGYGFALQLFLRPSGGGGGGGGNGKALRLLLGA